MATIKLLDCTLRDGGYLNDWKFGYDEIITVFERLVSAGIDVIEIGFLDERRTYDKNRTILPDVLSVNRTFDGMDKKQAYISAIDFVKNNTAHKYENYFSTFDRVLNGDIASLKENEVKSTGYVVDTLEASLWGFLNEKSYTDCVFRVINLGGDTDTIACVAGGLAGIYYGFNAINDNWVQMLQKKEMIDEMVERYCQSVK